MPSSGFDISPPSSPASERRGIGPRAWFQTVRRHGSLLQIVGGAALIAYVASLVDWRTTWEISVRAAPQATFAAGLAFLFCIFTEGLRYFSLVGGDARHLPWKEVMRIQLITYFGSLVLPGGTIVQELGRGLIINRRFGIAASRTAGAILVGRLCGVYFALLGTTCGIFLDGDERVRAFGLTAAGLAVGMALCCLPALLWPGRLSGQARALAIRLDHHTEGRFSAAALLERIAFAIPAHLLFAPATIFFTLASYAGMAATIWLLAIALGLAVSVPIAVFAVCAAALVWMLLPLSVMGVGARELGYVYLFKMFGIAPEETMALLILFNALSLTIGAIGGLLTLKSKVGI